MCVCVCVRVCWIGSGYPHRLVGLVKMRVRKYRVTDVAFLLSHTNMVILPPPASLIFHTQTHTSSVAVTTHTRKRYSLFDSCNTRHRYTAYSNVSRLECGNSSEIQTVDSSNLKQNKPCRRKRGHLSGFHIKNCQFKCF